MRAHAPPASVHFIEIYQILIDYSIKYVIGFMKTSPNRTQELKSILLPNIKATL